MLADVARHIGDVVAAVAAPTRAAARAAAQRVEVAYEELPAVFDPLEALEAPPIHERTVSAGEAVSIDVRPIAGTNVCHRFRIRHGDVAQGFAQADAVVEETYRTAAAAHAPMEPHAALAEWKDGRLTLWSGTQTPFNVRSDLAGLFGLPGGGDPRHRARRWAARSGPRPSCAWRRSSRLSRARPGGR